MRSTSVVYWKSFWDSVWSSRVGGMPDDGAGGEPADLPPCYQGCPHVTRDRPPTFKKLMTSLWFFTKKWQDRIVGFRSKSHMHCPEPSPWLLQIFYRSPEIEMPMAFNPVAGLGTFSEETWPVDMTSYPGTRNCVIFLKIMGTIGSISKTSPEKYWMKMLEIVLRQMIQFSHCSQPAGQYDISSVNFIL